MGTLLFGQILQNEKKTSKHQLFVGRCRIDKNAIIWIYKNKCLKVGARKSILWLQPQRPYFIPALFFGFELWFWPYGALFWPQMGGFQKNIAKVPRGVANEKPHFNYIYKTPLKMSEKSRQRLLSIKLMVLPPQIYPSDPLFYPSGGPKSIPTSPPPTGIEFKVLTTLSLAYPSPTLSLSLPYP